MKAAKMTGSEICPETPKLLKRYLGRGGIKVLSRTDGHKNYLVNLFYIPRQI